jgi:hypothetical protein
VLYDGPILDCIIAEPCDTLNVILQKIDEIICNLLTQINTLNIQVTNITTQIININSEIININNTLAVCCSGATTTTTSTTLCPCTYYEHVAVTQFPGTFTYVECDTNQVVTVTSGGEVDTVCVNNNYPTIEVGKINVLNTGVCCSVITTTTTTTVFIQSFCNQVTATGTVYIYWTNSNGYSEVMKIKDETVYICAQVGSIAFTGTGSISVIGSPTTCISDGECAPVTTTTTTTTISLPCVSYLLEASGPSTFPGDTDWEAVECNTNITVGGTIVYPNIVSTGCITDGSLLLGPKVIIVDSDPCPTTTTTTTAVVSCVEISINAAGNCPAFPGYSTIEYTDCNGVYQTVNVSAGDSPTFCSLVGGVTPAFTCGTGIITYGSTCTVPTTTTTSSSSTSTTSTTTTIAPCVEWTWEAVGANVSDLEYTDCEGLPVVIPAIDVTNNSGIICVYPNVTPEWNPAPTTGTHIIGTIGADCPTTTTTTTFAPCTIWSWEAIGFNVSGINYIDCNGQEVYIDPDDVTNNSGDICVYPNTTPAWSPAPVGGTHILGTTGDECIAPPTTTTTTTEPIPTYCYTLSASGRVTFFWIDVSGDPQTINITNDTVYVCAQLDSVVAIGLAEIEGGITPCTSDLECTPTTTSTTTATPTTTTTTSYTGCRPQGLITVEYFNSYDDGSGVVDYTASLLTACNACKYINGLPVGPSETSLFGQSATFAIGETVYAGTGTSCDTLADGFYITDHATCQITEIVGGSIVDITYCEPITTTTTSSSSSTSTTTSSSSTTTTTTTLLSCSTYKLIASGPSVDPGDTDWSGIDCFTGLPVGGTVSDLANTTTGCIVDGSLTYGVKVSIVETISCAVFELEPTCCDGVRTEYISLSSDTVLGTAVYTSTGYCYEVLSTSLLSPTIGLGSFATYADCNECTTANPCPTTTTTTTTL